MINRAQKDREKHIKGGKKVLPLHEFLDILNPNFVGSKRLKIFILTNDTKINEESDVNVSAIFQDT